jgi:hypothetical protein
MVKVIPWPYDASARYTRAYYCQLCYEIIAYNARKAIPDLQLSHMSSDDALSFMAEMLGMESKTGLASLISVPSTVDIKIVVPSNYLDEWIPLKRYHPRAEQLEKILQRGKNEGML